MEVELISLILTFTGLIIPIISVFIIWLRNRKKERINLNHEIEKYCTGCDEYKNQFQKDKDKLFKSHIYNNRKYATNELKNKIVEYWLRDNSNDCNMIRKELCQINNKELMEMNKMKTINKILAIGLVTVLLFGLMMFPTTCIVKEVYTVEYPEPIYKTVMHSEPIYQNVYEEVKHSEPIYETLYTLRLRYDLDDYYITQNVYAVESEYLGENWPEYNLYGYKLWNVEVYFYDGYDKKYVKYFDIECKSETNKRVEIVGHNTWTESVLDGQDIIGYDTWTETVIDRYDTKTENKYRDKEVNCLIYEKIFDLV